MSSSVNDSVLDAMLQGGNPSLCSLPNYNEGGGRWGVEGVDEGKMTYCWMLTPAILIQERGEGVQIQIQSTVGRGSRSGENAARNQD